MKKETNIILIVGGLIVIGVGGYFGYKAYQKNKDKKTGGGSGKGGGVTTSGGGSGNPLDILNKLKSALNWGNDDFLLDDGIGGSTDVPANTFLSAVDYLKRYPDVAATWGSSPYSHFIQNGKAEGRTWNVIASVSFKNANTKGATDDYLKRYPDVKSNWEGSPYLHFWQNGVREGRTWDYNL